MLQDILSSYFAVPLDIPMITLQVGTHDTNRDTSKFRTSDAGKCHRMRFWKRQGKPDKQELTLETQMAMQTGNLLHAFIQHALDRAGVLYLSETELEDSQRIGHFDAIIRDGARYVMYDFKTMGGKKMYYLKQKPEPKREHIFQLLTYMMMYTQIHGQQPGFQPLEEGRVAYISRDTLEILDLRVPDGEYEVNKDWSQLMEYWDQQTIPSKTENTWECNYCQYKAECLPGG